MRSRLTGRSVAQNRAIHYAQTAYTGAWLGVFGTALVVLSRIADIVRLGSKAPAHWLFVNSWWLTVPVFLNVIILCPTIIVRAWCAKGDTLPAKEMSRASLAIFIATLLMLASIVYLVSVWLF